MITALVLIVLHTVSGRPIEINPRLITHMRGPEPAHSSFTEGARCMINFSDGKYITVRETCEEVKKLIGEKSL